MQVETGSLERFLGRYGSRIDFAPDGCWLWTGARFANGYGLTHVEKRSIGAHRVVYELFRGPIPDGLQLDHLCHGFPCPGGPTCPHRPCVNPAHLEPVTQVENVRRGANGYMPKEDWKQRHARTTPKCVRGHLQTPENVYEGPTGKRRCKVCQERLDLGRHHVLSPDGWAEFGACPNCGARAGSPCRDRRSPGSAREGTLLHRVRRRMNTEASQ